MSDMMTVEEHNRIVEQTITAMTEQWRKTNGEYERVSKALCRVQRQLTESQQEIARLNEVLRRRTFGITGIEAGTKEGG